MEKKKLLKILQGYVGMTREDKGCKTWDEMQNKMADEILSINQPMNYEKFEKAQPHYLEIKNLERLNNRGIFQLDVNWYDSKVKVRLKRAG